MKKVMIGIMIVSLFTAVIFGLEYQGITYEHWKEVLEKGSIQEKILALEAIGNIEAPDSEQLLFTYLDHENAEIRMTAVWALGQIRSDLAADKICWMLGEENDPRIDGAMVNIGTPAVEKLILKLKLASMLNNFDEGTRIARIMIDIQSPEGMVEVASYLSKLLSIPDSRDEAKQMLSHIGERAVEPLQISLQTTYDKQLTLDILNQQRKVLSDVEYKRAKHVLTENQRVLYCIKALENGNDKEVGELLNQTHISLRDDYECSCEECDFLVEELNLMPFVRGARIMGGGFGGSIIFLAERDLSASEFDLLNIKYNKRYQTKFNFYQVDPSQGAKVFD